MAKTIIVPVDASPESQAATRQGAALASLLDAELLLVHIKSPNPADFSDVPGNRTAETDPDRLGRQQDAERIIGNAREVAESSGAARIDTRIVEDPSLSGSTAEQIVELAASYPDSHIVIGSRRLSELGRIVYDSISQAVLHKTRNPITVVYDDRDGPARIDKIVVPVDGSSHSDDAAELAGRMARADALVVDLVHVVGEQSLHDGPPDTETIFARARQQLGDTGAAIHEHLLNADQPTAGILEHAAEQPEGTVIVMGRRGLGHLTEHLLGSVSHKTVVQTGCPVTVVI